MKTEGYRGFLGIFIGMIFAGLVVWLFGKKPSLGFSGAVFACIGILLVRSIRENLFHTLILVLLLGTVFEFSFFETIRPSNYAIEERISWLGHLGGLIGGMLAQIRSRTIALQILFKDDKITEKEFIAIATRIHNEENVSEQSGHTESTSSP